MINNTIFNILGLLDYNNKIIKESNLNNEYLYNIKTIQFIEFIFNNNSFDLKENLLPILENSKSNKSSFNISEVDFIQENSYDSINSAVNSKNIIRHNSIDSYNSLTNSDSSNSNNSINSLISLTNSNNSNNSINSLISLTNSNNSNNSISNNSNNSISSLISIEYYSDEKSEKSYNEEYLYEDNYNSDNYQEPIINYKSKLVNNNVVNNTELLLYYLELDYNKFKEYFTKLEDVKNINNNMIYINLNNIDKYFKQLINYYNTKK